MNKKCLSKLSSKSLKSRSRWLILWNRVEFCDLSLLTVYLARAGVYIVHFDISPPPLSNLRDIFSPDDHRRERRVYNPKMHFLSVIPACIFLVWSLFSFYTFLPSVFRIRNFLSSWSRVTSCFESEPVYERQEPNSSP